MHLHEVFHWRWVHLQGLLELRQVIDVCAQGSILAKWRRNHCTQLIFLPECFLFIKNRI